MAGAANGAHRLSAPPKLLFMTTEAPVRIARDHLPYPVRLAAAWSLCLLLIAMANSIVRYLANRDTGPGVVPSLGDLSGPDHPHIHEHENEDEDDDEAPAPGTGTGADSGPGPADR